MMTQQEIDRIIEKYLQGKVTQEEINHIENLEQFAENKIKDKVFRSKIEKGEIKDVIFRNVQKNVQQKPKDRIWLRVAASVAILISIGVGYYFNSISTSSVETSPIIVNNNTIVPGKDKATLTLENGFQIVLEKGNTFKTQNANSDGEQIVYEAKEKNNDEIAYNYLTIPRGGQFFIKLSDGTQVWLNSESQLKYPVSFIERETRLVELVYGEAYFDVSPSTEHKGAKFKVMNDSQEVEVIGTEFNIKAYKDETNIYTTLVEGKVDVNTEKVKQSLIPRQQLNLDLNTNTSVVNTVDVYNEISWKEGVFSFEAKTLKEMMKVLSRWYDVEIIINNKKIENEEFVGILRRNKNLEEILTSIKNFGIIKSFEVGDKKVVLE